MFVTKKDRFVQFLSGVCTLLASKCSACMGMGMLVLKVLK
jgi:hypothetical protein